MFKVMPVSVDEEWPELGKVSAPNSGKVKVSFILNSYLKAPTKTKNKRKWKRLDDSVLAKPKNGDVTYKDGTSSGTISVDGSSAAPNNARGSVSSQKKIVDFSDNTLRKHHVSSENTGCLFVKPGYAGFEVPVTVPRPGFSRMTLCPLTLLDPSIVSHYRNLGRYIQTCHCKLPTCMFCEYERLDRIKYQVEFYFGVRNFARDSYLQSQMTEDRFVPVDVILAFPRMRQLNATLDDLVKSCGNSTIVEFDSNMSQIRRRDAYVHRPISLNMQRNHSLTSLTFS